MVTERLEVRLDQELRQQLDEIAACRGVPVSEAVRCLIKDAYREIDIARRMRAAEALAAMELADVPDPETLKRQLESTYDVTVRR